MKETEVNSIGMSTINPILDTRLYKTEYEYGYMQALASNVIAYHLFSQLYEQVKQHRLIYLVINVRAKG